MAKKPKKITFPSELRFDLASKDWVVIATGRAKRPEAYKRAKEMPEAILEKDCPFCQIKTQEKPTLIYANGKKTDLNKTIPKNWTTIVVPNKYPAFLPSDTLDEHFEGPLYQTMNAVGYHEVVVTRDHQKQLAQFTVEETKEVMDAYQERFLSMAEKRFVNYVSIFHNHGPEAGASISHPHSQIITTPLIDVDLKNALGNAQNYFQLYKSCVYCRMTEWERKSKKRIVFENKDFLVICPFASKTAFEVIITPKDHSAYFEKIGETQKWNLAEAFQVALRKIYKGLNDPDYNFYLHTAPCDGEKYDYYHWHWTILPKIARWAGFEIGTQIEISTIEPEKAAAFLKKQK